jgi:NAD-dependent histone deacetylase SIR2
MGQEESVPIAEGIEPRTLESRTLEAVASYLKGGRAKRVVVLVSHGKMETEFVNETFRLVATTI